MIGGDFLHMVKVLMNMDNPETQTTQAERTEIQKYAKGKKVAVEIGVFEGVNTVAIAKAIDSNGQLYGIDPFFSGRLGVSYSRKIVHHLLRQNKLRNVKLVEKLSFDAVNDVPDNVDFMFIDGDHSYEGIKKDWESFSPKMVSGGFILLHDTTVPVFDPLRERFGSIQYFSDVIARDERFELVSTVDSLNVLKRI